MIPITGAAVPGLGAFDQSVRDLMQKYKIPSGAVAPVRDGMLIYARGLGYADVENKTCEACCLGTKIGRGILG